MHHLKTFLVALLLQLTVALIISAVTTPPQPLTVTVPIVIVHVTH